MAGTFGERAAKAGRRAAHLSVPGLVAALIAAAACILSTSTASASAVAAAPHTIVSPPSAAPGSLITVSLSDPVPPGTGIRLTITGPVSSKATQVDAITGAANSAGAYSQAIALPASFTPGLYTVLTCAELIGDTTARPVRSICLAPVTLQVVLPTKPPPAATSNEVTFDPRLTATPDQAQPGATIELSGSGWDPRGGSVRVFMSRAAADDDAAALSTSPVGPRGHFRGSAQIVLTTTEDTYTLYACQRCGATRNVSATAQLVVVPLLVPSTPAPSAAPAQSLGPTASTDYLPPGEATAGVALVVLLVLGGWLLGSRRYGHRRTRQPSPHDMRLVGYPGPPLEVSVSRPGPHPALTVRLVPHPDRTEIRELVEVR
jgi:hypothetical protein